MMTQILDFAADNMEWIIPLALVLLELLLMKIPTKDPAGILERAGRILRLILESRIENRRKNFQGKIVDKPHNDKKL
jgi:hypothetical protein